MCGHERGRLYFRCMATLKKGILSRLQESQFFSIQIDETTDVTTDQQCGVMLRFFDNVEGKVDAYFMI